MGRVHWTIGIEVLYYTVCDGERKKTKTAEVLEYFINIMHVAILPRPLHTVYLRCACGRSECAALFPFVLRPSRSRIYTVHDDE